MTRDILRVGIGGPVGAGKTTLVEKLCGELRGRFDIGVVTNDIYTQEDMEILLRAQALPEDRIIGVETGGCPHTAIREDASINISAIDELARRHPELQMIIVESGGDNLSATFSPELVDLTLYLIDVAAGEKVPRKGGPAGPGCGRAPAHWLLQPTRRRAPGRALGLAGTAGVAAEVQECLPAAGDCRRQSEAAVEPVPLRIDDRGHRRGSERFQDRRGRLLAADDEYAAHGHGEPGLRHRGSR